MVEAVKKPTLRIAEVIKVLQDVAVLSRMDRVTVYDNEVDGIGRIDVAMVRFHYRYERDCQVGYVEMLMINGDDTQHDGIHVIPPDRGWESDFY